MQRWATICIPTFFIEILTLRGWASCQTFSNCGIGIPLDLKF